MMANKATLRLSTKLDNESCIFLFFFVLFKRDLLLKHGAGLPGDLLVSVTFLLIGSNKLGVKMEAKALDKATSVNLALHTYWNLGGHRSGNILSHEIQLFTSKITPVDSQLIPTGQISDIKDSAYDFLQPRDVGSRIDELPHGYDINYVHDGHGHEHLNRAAVLRENKSGGEMQLSSNQVGKQFYTGNYLNNMKGKGTFVYSSHAGP